MPKLPLQELIPELCVIVGVSHDQSGCSRDRGSVEDVLGHNPVHFLAIVQRTIVDGRHRGQDRPSRNADNVVEQFLQYLYGGKCFSFCLCVFF